MKKLYLGLVLLVLSMSLVFAISEQAGINAAQQAEEGQQIAGEVRSGTYIGMNGEEMEIETDGDRGLTLRVKNVEAHTYMNMTQESVQNRTRLHVELSNGFNSEVKVMPNTASERALAVLRAKCEARNCTIELKEVSTGNGNQTRAVYEMKTQKEARVLGLFRARMQIQTNVDAETAEVIMTKKPWWSFLATESAE
jgi:hypothetical protein